MSAPARLADPGSALRPAAPGGVRGGGRGLHHLQGCTLGAYLSRAGDVADFLPGSVCGGLALRGGEALPLISGLLSRFGEAGRGASDGGEGGKKCIINGRAL